MNPNENEDLASSPKDQIDYSKMTEAQRQADFRKKRQEYINEKMSRKKVQMKLKKQQFGDSSSDSSDQDGPGSRSSGSSAMKSQKKGQPQLNRQLTPKKLQLDPKSQQTNSTQLPQQVTPSKKKSECLQKIAINIPSKKGGNEWVKDVLVIGEKTIIIQNLIQQYKKITKVKIIADPILGSPFKIKITSGDQDIIFSCIMTQQKSNLPVSYNAFSRLVQQKLIQLGHRLSEPVPRPQIANLPQSLITGCHIYGKINKKSQVLGNWQQRLIIINKDGIFSYKKYNQKHSMFIPAGTINQLWTRFEVSEGMLIIKIWYSSKKTQFGIPLTDVINGSCWLYWFYSMMGKAK